MTLKRVLLLVAVCGALIYALVLRGYTKPSSKRPELQLENRTPMAELQIQQRLTFTPDTLGSVVAAGKNEAAAGNATQFCADSASIDGSKLTQCILNAIHTVQDKDMPGDIQIFNPKHPHAIHTEMLELLHVFATEVTSHNLTYFMFAGTLLGSWRHHGIIPWDDDADVFADEADKPKLKEAMRNMPPRYGLFTDPRAYRWKMYVDRPRKAEHSYNWGFPFLDIVFYRRNATHIIHTDPFLQRLFHFDVTDVFPLVKRPFHHLSLNAPRHTSAVLGQTFNVSTCVSGHWDHRKEKAIRQQTRVPCSRLAPYFPFVRRERTADGTREYLTLNSTVINYFDVRDW